MGAQGWLSVPGREPGKYPSFVSDNGYEAGPILASYLGNLYRRGMFDGRVLTPERVSPDCRLNNLRFKHSIVVQLHGLYFT